MIFQFYSIAISIVIAGASKRSCVGFRRVVLNKQTKFLKLLCVAQVCYVMGWTLDYPAVQGLIFRRTWAGRWTDRARQENSSSGHADESRFVGENRQMRIRQRATACASHGVDLARSETWTRDCRHWTSQRGGLSRPVQGGPTAETALAGSTAQANVPDARCARTVTGLGGNGGGFRGASQPGKFQGFFQKSTDPHEG